MIAPTTDLSGREVASVGAADWLSLAAAPTLAIMALVTALGGPTDLLCLATQASPMNGMVPMYILMSAFHSAPWVRLILGRRKGGRRS